MSQPCVKCTDCNHYKKHLDFGHDKCQEHRACHTREGYDPTRCESCLFNRGVWDPLSRTLAQWRQELRLHSRRMGGEVVWPFASSFSSFFEVILASGSESESRSRGPSPMGARGSRSISPRPRASSTARSPASRHSRSPHAGWGRRDGRSAGSRPFSSPRRSRSPFGGGGDHRRRSAD